MRIILVLVLIVFTFNASSQEKIFVLDTIYNPAKGEPKNVALIYFGGSEGGLPTWESENFEKNKLPEMGIATLGVAYFGSENTPKYLDQLPLEYWEQVIKEFTNRPEIRDKKIVVDGISKGGELALLLGSKFNTIDGVISKAPSSVVWQGLAENYGFVSSWSYKGESIPFVPFYRDYDYSTIEDFEYLMSYTLGLTQKDAVDKAVIKVENTKGPILLFSGESDQMWPSTFMGELIVQRLKEHNFSYKYYHHHYKNANHSFDPNANYGSKEANNKAFEDMHSKITAFLIAIATNKN